MAGRKWTDEELELLRKLYPDMPTREVAAILGRSMSSVYQQALAMGAAKSAAYLTTEASGRKQKGCLPNAGSYKRGQTPHNKGRRQAEWISEDGLKAVKAGQFKPGQLPHNTKWDGYERTNKEGYVEVRLGLNKFVPKHRLVWEQHYGAAIPEGGVVVFRDGNKSNFDPDNLCLITRAELMANNTIHQYPAELQMLMRMQKKLLRLIDKKSNHEDNCK